MFFPAGSVHWLFLCSMPYRVWCSMLLCRLSAGDLVVICLFSGGAYFCWQSLAGFVVVVSAYVFAFNASESYVLNVSSIRRLQSMEMPRPVDSLCRREVLSQKRDSETRQRDSRDSERQEGPLDAWNRAQLRQAGPGGKWSETAPIPIPQSVMGLRNWSGRAPW